MALSPVPPHFVVMPYIFAITIKAICNVICYFTNHKSSVLSIICGLCNASLGCMGRRVATSKALLGQ